MEYWDKLRQLGCIVCRQPPHIHHLLTGRAFGRKTSHSTCIGLCPNHHIGPEGIHTLGKRAWERKYGLEVTLLAETLKRLGCPS